MTAQASRRTRLYFPGALLLVAVLVMVTGGLTWRQQKENTRGR